MLWAVLRWLFWRPRYNYEIVVGTSFSSADDAAAAAQIRTNATAGEAIGIAADAIVCCVGQFHGAGEEAGTGPGLLMSPHGTVQFNVYVLKRI